MACWQKVLSAVHASIKLVTAAIKGYEAVTGEFQELVRQLSSNEVPRAWLVPQGSGPAVELNHETLSAWVADLTERMEFIYQWAVDGPPVVVPLGMLARPKAFLTAVQQIHAQRLDVPVGALTFEGHILVEGATEIAAATRDAGVHALSRLVVHSAEGGSISVLDAAHAGCLVAGCVLQGAKWQPPAVPGKPGGWLEEAPPSAIFSTMPLIWLVPVPETLAAPNSKQPLSRAVSQVAGGPAARGSEGGQVPGHLGMVNSGGQQDMHSILRRSQPGAAQRSLLGGISINGSQQGQRVLQANLSLARAPLATGSVPAARSVRLSAVKALMRASRSGSTSGAGSPLGLTPSTGKSRLSIFGAAAGLEAGHQEEDGSDLEEEEEEQEDVAQSGVSFRPGVDQGHASTLLQQRYVCPAYLHTTSFGGNRGGDVDDCLFDLLLPPGEYSPEHWVTRNVVVLVCADPGQLVDKKS